MPAIIAAIVAGGLSFGSDALSSHAQRKQQKKYKKKFGAAVNSTEAIQGASLGQREALARLATQQQVGGFDAARREASRLGRGAKQSALDRETQQYGRASQALANSGLGSTTIGANLNRGIASDTNRQLSGIDEGLAQLYGNLSLGRAGAESAGSDALAALAGERGNTMSQLSQMRTMGQFYGASPWGGGGPMPEIPHSFGQSLIGGVQTGLGTYMGMGGGGGGMGGGMGQGMGGMDPRMREYLFGGRPGGFNYGGQQPLGTPMSSYYGTFAGG